ncbi:unnamed protein product [Knipowitschia caucasica]
MDRVCQLEVGVQWEPPDSASGPDSSLSRKEVGVQWDPPDSDLVSCPDSQVSHREVGVQCDRTQTSDSAVQVDLITQALTGDSIALQCVSVRGDGPQGGALLQHCVKARGRGRPRRDQTKTKPKTEPVTRPETKPERSQYPDTKTLSEPNPEAKDPHGSPVQTSSDQYRTQTRTRTRQIRPSPRYQDYEFTESSERKRRRGAEEEEDKDKDLNRSTDPNWTPATLQNSISQDAAGCGKEEEGLATEGGVVCEVCGKVMACKSSLQRHVLVHSGTQPYCCRFCRLRFNRKDNLQHHLRIMHPHGSTSRLKPRPSPVTWLCHTCGKTFLYRSRLKTHEMIHTGLKPCKCPLCNKSYMRMNDLEHHIKRRHPNGTASPPPPPQHLCHHCGRSFSCQSLLSLHMQRHTGERPHLCHLCGRSFSRRQQLQVHTATTHHMEAPQTEEAPEAEGDAKSGLVCDICGRRMRSMSQLEDHRAAHSGEKPFRCGECGKRFLRVQTLEQHQIHFHNSAPPAAVPAPSDISTSSLRGGPAPSRPCSFACSVCSRTFRFPSLLLAHMVVHSESRPYQCHVCARSFRRIGHLKRHTETVHPDGQPRPAHVCPICHTDQQYRSKLERHLLVHSGDRPYNCERCSQSFARLGNLHQHQQRIHGDPIPKRRYGYNDDTPPIVFSEEDEERNPSPTEGQEPGEEGEGPVETGVNKGEESGGVGAEEAVQTVVMDTGEWVETGAVAAWEHDYGESDVTATGVHKGEMSGDTGEGAGTDEGEIVQAVVMDTGQWAESGATVVMLTEQEVTGSTGEQEVLLLAEHDYGVSGRDVVVIDGSGRRDVVLIGRSGGQDVVVIDGEVVVEGEDLTQVEVSTSD